MEALRVRKSASTFTPCANNSSTFQLLSETVLSSGATTHHSPRTGSHGAEGARTPDLLGAIQALSQLSYSPVGCST